VSEPPRVPEVRSAAVAGDFALVGGYSAEFLGRLLIGYPGGLERLLARSGVPPGRRDDVLRAVRALVHVGTSWRLQIDGSGSGNDLGAMPDHDAPSQRGLLSSQDGEASSPLREASPFLGTSEVAGVLGVSTRMVRRLASTGALPGQRDAGGRWLFAVVDVAAERDRRMNDAGDRDVV